MIKRVIDFLDFYIPNVFHQVRGRQAKNGVEAHRRYPKPKKRWSIENSRLFTEQIIYREPGSKELFRDSHYLYEILKLTIKLLTVCGKAFSSKEFISPRGVYALNVPENWNASEVASINISLTPVSCPSLYAAFPDAI